MSTTVAVVGASGKLGTLVCRLVNESADFELVAELGSKSDLADMLVADLIVDVSLPSVSKQVLEYALENDERFGIWGGLSERERRKLRKRA